MYARGATGYCSNYYENQRNKLVIINQSTFCYSFTSLSNKAEKKKKLREPWSSKMSQKSLTHIVNQMSCKIIQRERESFHEIIHNAMNISDIFYFFTIFLV